MMDGAAARLRLASDVFNAAVDQPESTWDEIVRARVGTDEAAYQDVMQLLDVHRRNSVAWDDPAQLLGRPDRLPDRSGITVGAYRLVRLVGRGGMGAVYEAVRTDGVYEHHVAVKLISSHLSGQTMMSRFRRERQILAALAHPNIARLLDGGESELGEPFLVMEYIDGTAITRYADAERLSVDERIGLFLQACSAVQYAHGRLVVHRDIKPANILVTPEREVKLLDFGVARLLATATDGPYSTVTQFGAQAFTPEYASPEQLRDEAPAVPSDVYSLGVVLCELLAGARPHELPSRSLAHALAASELPPPRPSTLATETGALARGESSAARLRRKLVGELDNIIRKAVNPDATRRYASAADLGRDLRKYLAGQPVEAQPDSRSYRARKFAKRHWRWLSVVGVLGVAVLAGAVTASVQASRANRERVFALRTSSFLTNVLSAPDAHWARAGDPNVRIADILDEAAARTDTAFADDPSGEAILRRTLGGAYRSLGKYAAAEQQLGRALAIDRGRDGDPSRITQDEHALGWAFFEQGDFPTATPYWTAAAQRCLRATADTTLACYESISDYAVMMQSRQLLAKTDSITEEDIRRGRRIFVPMKAGLFVVLENLSGVADARGQTARADSLLRAAEAVRRQMKDPPARESAVLMGVEALHLIGKGDPRGDADLAAAIAKGRSVGLDPSLELTAMYVAAARRARRTGQPALAAALLDSARSAIPPTISRNHPWTSSVNYEAGIQQLLAVHPVRAESLFRLVVAARAPAYPLASSAVRGAEMFLAISFAAQRRYSEASRILAAESPLRDPTCDCRDGLSKSIDAYAARVAEARASGEGPSASAKRFAQLVAAP